MQDAWGVDTVDELSEIDQILDTGTLTLGELLLAGLAMLIAAFIARWVRRAVRSFLAERDNIAPHLPDVIGRVSGWCVMLGGIVMALMIVGVQMGPVVLLLLIVVAIVGISGRQILEDFAAGLSLQITTPFVVGDRIETAGTTGWVDAITGRAVVLTSRDRRTVHIPNSTVLESVLYNYTDDQQRRTEMGFAVSYIDDPVLAGEVASAAVAGLDLVHPEPAPVAFVNAIGDDGYEFLIRFYHDDEHRKPIRTQVAKAIVDALTSAGINLPTPELAITELPSPPTHNPT
jgi:small conductance mechanosensitive channel